MSDLHRYLGDLTAAALMGTARRPELPAPPAALADLLGTEAASPAEGLLDAAAATTLALRAGALPRAGAADELPPCPADELPPCGRQAARHLETMLAGRQHAILAEWLQALAASKRRAPDASLPALIEVARTEQWLRPLVLATIGARGRWLAGLNPAWAFATRAALPAHNPATLAEVWQTGPRSGRLFLLQALRAEDPAQARALLESTWASERADDRAAFVETLEAGLSMADEPFLEAALDDRGKEVRAAAAALLARLPDSRLAQRMAARGLELVQRSGGLLAKIEVRLPEECNKALQRDGVRPKPQAGMGERAWWLSEIVRRTPPAAWCAAWSLTPAQILATRAPKEWRELLLKSWAAAAITYADAEWAAALADLAPREAVPLAALIPIISADRRDQLLIRLLADGRPLGSEHPALGPLRAAPGPWSRELTRAAIGAIARRFARLDEEALTDWHLRAALDEFALAMPPELAEEAIAALPDQLAENRFWAASVQSFAERLRLRRDMYAALREHD